MTPDVVALYFSNTAYDGVCVFMAEKEVGCIIITKGNGRSRTQKGNKKNMNI